MPQPRRLSEQAEVLLAANPGPMTLDGTNSYLLASPDSPTRVIVDPGPDDEAHLATLAAQGPISLILITHRHPDHTAGSAALAAITGAPVRAKDPDFCIGAGPLVDGEQIEAAGVGITVVATPGHTDDSVCFFLADAVGSTADDRGAPSRVFAPGSMLTGDTILGRGTTVIAPPDGALRPYLASLATLMDWGPIGVLPAHGPQLPNLAQISRQYLAHRQQRLVEIRAALSELGADASVAAVTDVVYAAIDPSVRWAAEQSVGAQLDYLRA